jgi:hypothetical protein
MFRMELALDSDSDRLATQTTHLSEKESLKFRRKLEKICFLVSFWVIDGESSLVPRQTKPFGGLQSIVRGGYACFLLPFTCVHSSKAGSLRTRISAKTIHAQSITRLLQREERMIRKNVLKNNHDDDVSGRGDGRPPFLLQQGRFTWTKSCVQSSSVLIRILPLQFVTAPLNEEQAICPVAKNPLNQPPSAHFHVIFGWLSVRVENKLAGSLVIKTTCAHILMESCCCF